MGRSERTLWRRVRNLQPVTIAVVVFTRDLRVRDNPALAAGCLAQHTVPLFVVDDAVVDHTMSANRLGFLADALVDLDASLGRLGGALVMRRGRWVDEVIGVARECGADVVHLAADVSHYAQRRRMALSAVAQDRGIAVVTHPGITVVPPGALLTGSATPYQMFTPYYRRWQVAPWRDPVAIPNAVSLPRAVEPGTPSVVADVRRPGLSPDVVAGGESVGLGRLRAWASEDLERYEQMHDAVADDATSRMSPYLHMGCLSPLEVAIRLRDRPGGAPFVRQLCWRDFFHKLLASNPALSWTDMRRRGTPSGAADEAFEAWCAGRTGYPLVDAGMRQLQMEGFMHNRVRMVAASFLVKDLDVPWQFGARHFMSLLVDGDIANNQLNWQWVAGTGTDANPHRVFNPIRQSQRFDPDGAYIRRYVSELADVDTGQIHDPSDVERARCGYPPRLVDHASAIAAYRARLETG